jgi:predicted PurR-regulated permease PerM
MLRMNSRLTAVILSLIASAVIALAFTAAVSFLLVKVGIAGFSHIVAVMIVMPLSFAVAAWFFARKIVIDQAER